MLTEMHENIFQTKVFFMKRLSQNDLLAKYYQTHDFTLRWHTFSRKQNLFVSLWSSLNCGQAACKVVLMLSNYSILANYSWLLVEGHFLFTLVSRSFFSLKKHLAWYIALSWGERERDGTRWRQAQHVYLKQRSVWFGVVLLLFPGVPLVVITFWGCAKYFFEDEG